MTNLALTPLTATAFAPYGDIIEADSTPPLLINDGMCERFDNLARLDFGDGVAGISLFRSRARKLPLSIPLMERHPLGSQAFLPISAVPFLVVVAGDNHGSPVDPVAFMTRPGQGINYLRNTWHAVLHVFEANALFAVVDRIGDGNNLQEHRFAQALSIASTDYRV